MENREIKFRAWDQEAHDWNNKFSTNVGGEHKPLTEMYDWEALKEYSMDVLDGDGIWKVMQYTGLKDKNGVEIYKSDIVKSFKEPYEDEVSINTVEFIRGCWTLVCKGKNDIPLFNYEPEHLEVIGNVYQNSDILK